jgi:hypothetical protein
METHLIEVVENFAFSKTFLDKNARIQVPILTACRIKWTPIAVFTARSIQTDGSNTESVIKPIDEILNH